MDFIELFFSGNVKKASFVFMLLSLRVLDDCEELLVSEVSRRASVASQLVIVLSTGADDGDGVLFIKSPSESVRGDQSAAI